jgi:hypothetical protein
MRNVKQPQRRANLHILIYICWPDAGGAPTRWRLQVPIPFPRWDQIYIYISGPSGEKASGGLTDIIQTLNNVKEIYDQITEDNDVFFSINKWRKSLQLYHDELYNKHRIKKDMT